MIPVRWTNGIPSTPLHLGFRPGTGIGPTDTGVSVFLGVQKGYTYPVPNWRGRRNNQLSRTQVLSSEFETRRETSDTGDDRGRPVSTCLLIDPVSRVPSRGSDSGWSLVVLSGSRDRSTGSFGCPTMSPGDSSYTTCQGALSPRTHHHRDPLKATRVHRWSGPPRYVPVAPLHQQDVLDHTLLLSPSSPSPFPYIRLGHVLPTSNTLYGRGLPTQRAEELEGTKYDFRGETDSRRTKSYQCVSEMVPVHRSGRP